MRFRYLLKIVFVLQLVLTVLVVTQAAQAQTDSADAANPRQAHLELLARSAGDSVILRWAPTKPGAWSIANKLGYILERVKVDTSGAFDRTGYQRVTAGPIKPWTLDQWKQRAKPDNKFAAVAAQILYGKSPLGNAMDYKNADALKAAADDFTNRHGFALFAADNDPVAAEGLGLRYVDHNVHLGERYIYRLYLTSRDSSYAIDTAYLVQEITEAPKINAPANIEAEGRDGQIVLQWDNIPGQSFSGYYVYRKAHGENTFRQLTPTPVIAMTPHGAKEKVRPQYHDTTVVNYTRYTYQVRGVTAFGEKSEPAEIESFGRDLHAPPAPIVKEPKTIGKTRVQLQWEMSNAPSDLKGFVVARSPNAISGFTDLTKTPLSPSTRTFTDENATETEPYYIVGSVDTAGNVSPSLVVYAFVIDSTPPSIPTGLTGTADSNGIVRLHWNLGPETNIIGYRVLWANDPTHEFTQRTNVPVKDTFFVDTISLKSLTKNVYYRIAAINQRYSHSELSPMLTVKRPDIIPPEASVFKNVESTDSSVILTWAASTSNDVMKQVLYRKREDGNTWSVIQEFGPLTTAYTDRNVEQSVAYIYEMDVVDSSGLHSGRPLGVRGRPYDTKVRSGINGLTLNYDSTTKQMHLHWQYAKPPKEDYWFVIYRSVGDHPVSQYKAAKSFELTFSDNSLPMKGLYKYAVKVRTSTGGESTLSPEVQTVIP